MKMSKWLFLSAVIFSASIVGCDKKDEGADTRVNFADSTFAMIASTANINEIAAAQVAADSSSDSTIAEFAAMLVADHSAAQQQLLSVASQTGLSTTNTIDADHQELIDSLHTLKGRSLDSVFIFAQIRDHEQAIFFYKDHEAHGLQRNLKFYNYDLLPVLNSHLQQARILAEKY